MPEMQGPPPGGQEQGGQPGGQVGDVINAVGKGLQMLSKANEAFGEVLQHYVQVVQQVSGGGQPPAGQPGAPEQGGARSQPAL
jgi:hypothetical protein